MDKQPRYPLVLFATGSKLRHWTGMFSAGKQPAVFKTVDRRWVCQLVLVFKIEGISGAI
jgi:hypothetical protein